jgi:hypothetical protein
MGYKKLDKKVFDYLKMPKDVQDAFDKFCRENGQNGLVSIDVYQECYDGTESYIKVKDGEELWREDDMVLIRGNDIIGDWLLDNGATPWEEVIVDYPQ